MASAMFNSFEHLPQARVCSAVDLPKDLFGPQESGKPLDETIQPFAKASTPSILIFGWDFILLRTRELMLSRRGYVVRTAMRLEEVERNLAEASFELMIFCHSIGEEECARALQLAESQPHLRCLILISGSSGSFSPMPGEMLNIFEGPEKLVSTVDRILSTASTSSSQTPH